MLLLSGTFNNCGITWPNVCNQMVIEGSHIHMVIGKAEKVGRGNDFHPIFPPWEGSLNCSPETVLNVPTVHELESFLLIALNPEL